ncbi:MAG: aldehyde ferredoxin oxidoreductase [Promethearchaeota archaeon]|nr:MAG: aldehyde ferredoxin oxidoreductase [Candidatus Lokiarchaeota archaeon]
MFGYQGKFLKVDLGASTFSDIILNPDDLRKYLGGASLAAKMIYPYISFNLDPFSPDNPLIFAIGPLTGSGFPMVSRSAICGISPLTGLWGEATTGGIFPIRLKSAGYDGIFITGKADNPVYLYINNGIAEIKDSSQIWGANAYKTQEIIKKELEGIKVSVSCIGEAGEKLSNVACVMNDEGRAAGRCGLGALMGSKNLKAVAVAGNKTVDFAEREQVLKIAKELMADLRKDPGTIAMREFGTNQWIDAGMYMADVPTKYFSKSIFPAKLLSAITFREEYSMENYACSGCPIGCGRTIKNFGDEGITIDGPEYETVAAFGPLCMNFDKDVIIKANHLCNKHGIDTISTGVIIAFSMYLYENGILTRDTAGMEIKWGDGNAILKLIDLIVKKEGIGKILAKGTKKMAEEFGVNIEDAAQVKGLEIPMHDARAFHAMALIYATGPRGACHCKGDYYLIDFFSPGIQEYKISMGERFKSKGKAIKVAKLQSYREMFDALTLCKFSPLSPTIICNFLSKVTGWDFTPDELLEAGDRSINLKRAINFKLGMTRESDKLPKIATTALAEGTSKGQEPDLDVMLKKYYKYRDWDWKTGKPSKQKLIELGLDKIANDLW